MPEVQLAEAVGALSLAVDIGMEQPLEQGLRTCSLALGLARAAELDEDDCRRVYYLALLRHVGCTESDQAAHFLGDEIAFRRGSLVLDFSKPSSVLPYAFRHVGEGRSTIGRLAQFGRMAAGSKRFMGTANSVCETGQLIAARLGLEPQIQAALWHVSRSGLRRGDRRSRPVRRRGRAVRGRLPARRAGGGDRRGHEAAGQSVRPPRRRLPGPCGRRPPGPARPESIWDSVIEDEPGARPTLSDERFDQALIAVADFADLKSTFTLGHSRGVADLAAAAGEVAGLTAGDVTTLRRAGWLHDVGRVGISTSIWSKEGALSRDEWEKVRLHPYYTERVLTRPPELAELGRLASLHHERVDGRGYHRAVPGTVLSRAARTLAAADGYRARIETRPHRPALPAEDAATSVRDEARAGSLDADAVEVVLQAAGHPGARRRPAQVGGLTSREVEVLGLLARSQSIKDIAGTLHITPKTADAHIQHIYTKLGVTTRAGATMFAVQHGIVDRSQDREISR